MTLEECYAVIGGNYQEFVKRLNGSEALAKRFALKFNSDQSYNQLLEYLQQQDWQQAFQASHTLKGVAANLSLTNLYLISSDICEQLRGGNSFDDKAKLDKLTYVYNLCRDTLAMVE